MSGESTSAAIICSAIMKSTVEEARKYSMNSAPVLITGESGTGKEVIAKLIHTSGRQSNGPYIRVNCAALSESLIESELFGHEEGAFTGAISQRIGRFELANGGTLLLDEISEVPVRIQAKLLRVLEEEEFERVGGNSPLRANVRIIATSNRDLESEIEDGNFREDLYYRLNVLQLKIAPLRERREDIAPLIQHFLTRFREESNVEVQSFPQNIMNQLIAFSWPGNVRQLRNVVHRACVLANRPTISKIELPRDEPHRSAKGCNLYDMKLCDAERVLIQSCLNKFHGNKTAAARHLGVTSRTLHNKLQKYGEAA